MVGYLWITFLNSNTYNSHMNYIGVLNYVEIVLVFKVSQVKSSQVEFFPSRLKPSRLILAILPIFTV